MSYKTFNIWDLKHDLRKYGVWYCLWMKHDVWSIFVAWRMNCHEDKVGDDAQRAHADWHYEQQLDWNFQPVKK